MKHNLFRTISGDLIWSNRTRTCTIHVQLCDVWCVVRSQTPEEENCANSRNKRIDKYDEMTFPVFAIILIIITALICEYWCHFWPKKANELPTLDAIALIARHLYLSRRASAHRVVQQHQTPLTTDHYITIIIIIIYLWSLEAKLHGTYVNELVRIRGGICSGMLDWICVLISDSSTAMPFVQTHIFIMRVILGKHSSLCPSKLSSVQCPNAKHTFISFFALFSCYEFVHLTN